MSKDLFGIDEEVIELPPYVIVQITPADGWRAIFEEDNGKLRMVGVACFALVELKADTPDGAPARIVRPMVATEDGQIEDTDAFEGFLCLVPPGGTAEQAVPKDLQGLANAARARRDADRH